MTPQIFDIPFGYTVRGVRARCRQVEDHAVTDTVPVEIPVLSSADAPLAFRAYKRLDNSTVFELRAHERRPLHAVRGPDGEPLDPDGLRRVLASMNRSSVTWRECPFDVPQGYIGKVRIDDLRRGPKDFRSIETDGLDAGRDRAASAAARMAFVDGVLHAVPPEPRWAVQTSIAAEPVVIRVDLEDLRAEPFRIERRKDMLRFAGFAKQDIRMVHDIEDHGLIDWGFDDVALSVHKAADFVAHLVRGASGEALMHMPAAFFPLLVDLREVLADPGRDVRRVAGIVSDIHASLATRAPEANGLCHSIRAYSRLQIRRYRDIEGLLASPAQEAEALKDARSLERRSDRDAGRVDPRGRQHSMGEDHLRLGYLVRAEWVLHHQTPGDLLEHCVGVAIAPEEDRRHDLVGGIAAHHGAIERDRVRARHPAMVLPAALPGA